jgi:Basic region leucine zipper
MHARKTRQRKKQAMQALQLQLEALKEDQIRLRQSINEKNTANILVGLFSSDGTKGVEDNPDVEILLRRQPEDIPDASNIPELPALILPGHHNSKKSSQAGFSFSSENDADDVVGPDSVFPDDGIDYQLLRKDRSKCTAAELDQIRRERNRMHAKRTRDRKRIMVEEMEKIIRKLEKENDILQLHLQSLFSNSDEGNAISPDSFLTPLSTGNDSLAVEQVRKHSEALSKKRQDREKLLNHLECLLMAAGAFETSEGGAIMSSNSANTSSDSTSAEISAESSGSEDDNPQPKRKKVDLAFIRQPIII